MSWLNATQVLPESQNESSRKKKWDVVGHLIILKESYDVHCGENKIGRDPSQCSIVLENKTLSKVHAVIESEGPDETFIYDEKSTNKTRLGKTVLKPHCRYKLNDGDVITFGNLIAKFIESSEADESDVGSQSLLSPCKSPVNHKNNQKNIILESPSINDSVYEADTQCRIDGAASSPDVFKTPQSVKSKQLQSRNDSDVIFSVATQNCLRNDDSSDLDDSALYDQPTQCNFKTPERPGSFKKNRLSRKSNHSDIFEMATQCPINDSVYDEPTQLPENDLDDDVFEEETQCIIPAKKKLEDSFFDAETQVPKDRIFDAETQMPNGKEEFLDENIFDIATQVPNKNKDIYDMETQMPNKTFDDDDENLYDAATQVPSSLRKDIFDAETQATGPGFAEGNNNFEAETQINKSSEEDIYDMVTQQPVGSDANDFIFNAETQKPEVGYSASSSNETNSYIFDKETQGPVEQSTEISVSQDDSNEIIAALPDSIFEESTQVTNKMGKETPDSGKKARKRPIKHDNASLFKCSKRRSTEDYLNDGQDDVLCQFMSQNSPVFAAKKEKDAFEEDLNLDGVPSQVFEMDTQLPDNNRNSQTDSGISDEGNSTKVYSPNPTVNDSGIKLTIDEKGKEDLIPTQIFKNKTVKNSINMVMSSSSDEDCDVKKDTRALEDSIPTQVVSQKNNRKAEDDIPTQKLTRNEDDIQTQMFRTQDNIPTQIFNNRVAETSDDETDSDIELPKNNGEIDDSETDSDIEVKRSGNINENIETSTSGESRNENFDIDDKSNNSFSMIKEGENSISNLSGSANLNESGSTNFSPTAAILKNQRILSPTQVMTEDDLFDDKMESMDKRKHVSSPTQVMSDSETDCEEFEVKKEASYDETQVLPLSPPANYEPRILNSQDAWMIGKDPEISTPKKNSANDEDEWGPLSLEMPSTQVFEKTLNDKLKSVSPNEPVSSKRLRDSEDLDTPKPKLKKENSPVFKSPKNLFKREIVIGANSPQNQRPSRIRKPTWKVKSNDEDEDSPVIKLTKRKVSVIADQSQDEDSPVIKFTNKRKISIIADDSPDEDSPVVKFTNKRKISIIPDESPDEDSPVIKFTKRKVTLIADESQDEDSPLIKQPIRTKPKPVIFEDSMLSQVYEDERNISKRRSARIQKSSSNSSCNSLEMETCSQSKKTRNSRKKSCHMFEPKIIFTGYENENQFRIIEDLGGERTTDLKEANVVVTDKVRRTVKFLSALALGLPIVGPSWLEKCSEEMGFIDPWPFLLLDAGAEENFGFNLRGSIAKAKRKKLLAGYSVFATQNAKPPVPELLSIVECCGGKALDKTPDIWPEKTIIITCPEDEVFWPPAKYRYVRIVHYEFLLTGVLKQTLPFRAFNLRHSSCS